ncbi:MAG TPA: RHS repeat-associated core domain-containing protein [Candidatus Nanoarchaeia archaeon]|nr:RHS repeat-associated core domain-containing protein [Candidatus Nanoarchaeia archaeon]
MDSRGIKKKKLIQVLSILAVTLIILFLILNINLKLNLTGKAIESQTSLANKTTSYIYGNGLIASYDSDGNEKFYINDHLGSGSVVLDENGNKISEESYYAFGEEKTSGDSRFTYTGKEKDDSGLYYYGARYYDSDSGRFTQPDPISGNLQNPQSLNKYVYVLNNPNKFVDPSGMDEKPTMLAYSASLGADWNGAFNNRPEKFKSEFNVVSREAYIFDGITDFVKEEMSKGNIPDVLYIGFHGSPKTMGSLIVVESGIKITNYDKILMELGEILPASTTIVLESCSTGAECGGYNVAEAVNILTGKRVIAPTESSAVGAIYVDSLGRTQVEEIVRDVEVSSIGLKQWELPWKVGLSFFFNGGAVSSGWSYTAKSDTIYSGSSRTISSEIYRWKYSQDFSRANYKETEENLYREFK